MSTIKRTLAVFCTLGFATSAFLSGTVEAADLDAKVILSKPKISKSLKELGKPLPELSKARVNKMLESGEKVPGINKIEEVPNRSFPFAQEYIDKYSDVQDSVLQRKQKSTLRSSKMASLGLGFDGLGNVTGAVPPDTNADVGPNHIVQTVNTALSVWDKEGNQLIPPVAINSLWAGFGGLCESTNRGDPIVLYDSQADRWLISQFAFNGSFTDNHQCIAISQTADPTGAYYLYDFFYSDTKFNDYPHYGVWTDAYYAGVNQFTGSFVGSGVVAYERDKMLLGQPAQQVIFDLEETFPNAFTPMPADIDGVFLPPSDMPGIFVTADDAGELNVWHFNVDWVNPANSTFDLADTLAVAPYNGAVCGFSRDCVVQPNAQRLDVIGQRMMFRLAYRNLNGQSKLVANHNVVGSDVDSNIAGVRWYELDLTDAGMPSLANNGTYNLEDGNSRWMGSAAMDAVGNIGVAYSVSGPDTFPSIRFSGRLSTDPANTLTLPETELRAGEGSQSGANRWGDYSSLSVDPTDDCTFWYTTEYYQAGNDNTTGWQTHIGSFKFDDCVAGPAGKIAGVVTDSATGLAIEGAQVTIGALTVTTNDVGEYTATLPVSTGNALSVFKYGWLEGSASAIDVTENETTTVDLTIDPATPVTVTGTVRDGSGLGTELLAEIVVAAPGTTITAFTDPLTGAYSVDLFEGTLVQMSASAVSDGYMDQSVDILPENVPVQDFNLMVAANCTAEGYEFTSPTFMEDFEAGVPPTGWTIENTGGVTETWKAASLTARGNLLGTGEAVVIDSDAGGSAGVTGGTLTSPVLNVADIPAANLQFMSWFRTFSGTDAYDVEINVDGAGWVPLGVGLTSTNSAELITVDFSASIVGATSFQLRWNYEAFFEYYAYVDDVQLGGGVCVPRAGSILKGAVTDANTGLPLNGALVVAGADSTMTVATESADIADGFFNLFVADTATEVMVSAGNYATATVAVADVSLATPIALDAGQVDIAPQFPITTVTQGRIGNDTFTVDNTGNVDVDAIFLLTMLPPGAFGNQALETKATGPFHPSSRHFGPKALNEFSAKKIRHKMEAPNVPESTATFVGGFSVFNEAGFPWGMGVNQDNGDFWVGDLLAGGGPADALYQYDATGTFTGNSIDNSSISGIFAADMAYNNRTGMFWQVEVGNANCIHEIDPVALTVTGNQICPAFGVSQRGLAYDPLTDTFYSGSWNDSIIHQFDTTGQILRSVNVGLPVSGLAINPVTNSLYVMSNAAVPVFDITVLDAGTANLLPVSGINFPLNIDFTGDGIADDLLPANQQSGLAIDCDGNLWTPSRPFGAVLGISSGETNICEWKELPWLKFAAGNTTGVPANGSADIDLEFATSDLVTGIYQAQMITTGNTPYPDSSSIVTLNVTAPNFGALGFATTATNAVNGGSVTLTVNRTGGGDYPVSIDYQTADATALAGTHFEGDSGTLTWEDGDVSPKTISIATTDTAQTRDLGFSVILSNANGGAAIGDSSASVVIFKDKPKSSGGGSFGYGFLLLLGLAGVARRRRYK